MTLPHTKDYNAKANSIYIFCFDGWSFSRTFSDPDQLAQMTGLKELMERADVFTKARSPDITTPSSIPRFLFQSDRRMREMPPYELQKLMRSNLLGRQGLQSIFDLSDDHFKALLGCYLHYPSLVGSRVDYCGRFNPESNRVHNWRLFRSLMVSQAEFVNHLGMNVRIRSSDRNFDTDLLGIQSNTGDKLLEVITQLPQMNIAYFHILFPHFPYQYNADGSRRGAILLQKDASDLAGYHDNLIYMDRLIRKIMLQLQQRGDYESSLIVLLSDHNWRQDPDIVPLFGDYKAGGQDDPLARPTMQHVPLIIKHPGQSVPRRYDQAVDVANLHVLFTKYLENGARTMDCEWWH